MYYKLRQVSIKKFETKKFSFCKKEFNILSLMQTLQNIIGSSLTIKSISPLQYQQGVRWLSKIIKPIGTHLLYKWTYKQVLHFTI